MYALLRSRYKEHGTWVSNGQEDSNELSRLHNRSDQYMLPEPVLQDTEVFPRNWGFSFQLSGDTTEAELVETKQRTTGV